MQNRCSYCHVKGHNRASCPNRKAKVAELRAKKEAGKIIHWDEEDLIIEDDLRLQRKAKARRKCSYCHKRKWNNGPEIYEHDRRNCPVLAADKEREYAANAEWREKALQVLKDYGIGPGAIFDDSYYGRSMITKILWDNMNKFISDPHSARDMPDACFHFVTLKDMATTGERVRVLRFPVCDFVTSRMNWALKKESMVTPATSRLIDADMPEGWIEDKTALRFYFSTKND